MLDLLPIIWILLIKNAFAHFSAALFYGSIASFIAGVLLLMSFASPYWLASWKDTQSPFVNMGLWEFCFYKFRHPDYQFVSRKKNTLVFYAANVFCCQTKWLPCSIAGSLVSRVPRLVRRWISVDPWKTATRMANGSSTIRDFSPNGFIFRSIHHRLPITKISFGMDSTLWMAFLCPCISLQSRNR